MKIPAQVKLLDKNRGLVPYSKAKVFYVDSKGKTSANLSVELTTFSGRVHTLFTNYKNGAQIEVFDGLQVYTQEGWKDIEKIKKGDKVVVFESVTFNYGGTELRMIFSDVQSRQSKRVENLEAISTSIDTLIVDGLLVR